MATIYILDVTDPAANVQVRAGLQVLDTSTGTGAGILAAASMLAQLDDTTSKRPTLGEARAWRAMRTLAAGATDPAIANVVMHAYPDARARKAGKVASGIDRAFLKRIGADVTRNLASGLATTLQVNDAGQVRTLAFVPASAMAKLKELPVGGQNVPASVKRALPKLLAA
ncbi:MAG: hypothetical protein BWY85_00732 [Firmicutes bacterium ADurb.Bin506]|nr:MAG: hypothetical protein BWY85_00732 [Firmicutes bacterium ADurb.Bin506]